MTSESISTHLSPNIGKLNLDNKTGDSSSPSPSHNMEGNYVALMETNGKECESWYYFILYKGNEKALLHLQKQLEDVDWYIEDDLSTFDLDLEHFVSAKTAKEMTKLELNSYAFHRKFDGKLKEINLNFRKKDKTEKRMCKAFDQLGYGQVEDFIDDEDLDSEDLTDNDDSTNDDSTDESSDSESSDEEVKKDKERPKGIPPALLNSDRPNWAKAKGKKHRNH